MKEPIRRRKQEGPRNVRSGKDARWWMLAMSRFHIESRRADVRGRGGAQSIRQLVPRVQVVAKNMVMRQ